VDLSIGSHPIIGVFLSVSTPHHTVPEIARTDDVTGAFARRFTEPRNALRTTEFAAYVIAVVGVLIASYLVGDSDGRGDVFLADKAWLYVTLLTIGYLVSRGLAKAGSRVHRDA
jgi:hypothetical protein